MAMVIGLGAWLTPAAASAQGIELSSIQVRRADSELILDFAARLNLSRPVEEALQRGVPVYFVAQATVLRSRWYWRDARISRVQRQWRIAYQPLTSTWRVSLGALSQTAGSLSEALAIAGATGGWRIADLAQLDPDSRHYVEFVFQLDSNQLPSPMQITLPGQSDWVLRVERRIPVE